MKPKVNNELFLFNNIEMLHQVHNKAEERNLGTEVTSIMYLFLSQTTMFSGVYIFTCHIEVTGC